MKVREKIIKDNPILTGCEIEASDIARVNGEARLCEFTECNECDFDDDTDMCLECEKRVQEWLESEVPE